MTTPTGGPGFWPVLDALLAKKKRLRVLLANQSNLRHPLDLPKFEKQRLDEGLEDPLRLRGLAEETLEELAPDLAAGTRARADGRPLFVLLGDDPDAEIARHAERRLNLAAKNADRRALLLGALAGPVSHRQRMAIADTDAITSSLERMFEGEDRRTLKKVLPAIRPEMLADEIVMRFADEQSEADFMALFEAATGVNAAAVERRLASLWNRSGEANERAETRQDMQDRFDQLHPEKVEEMHARANELAEIAAKESPGTEDGTRSIGNIVSVLDELGALADGRPFDARVRTAEARAAAASASALCSAKQFDELESWGDRMIELSNQFLEDTSIKHNIAGFAYNAMRGYGGHKEFAGLERWSKLISRLVEADPNDENLRTCEAIAISNAVRDYGMAGLLYEMEGWAWRFETVAAAMPDSTEIRQLQATTAVRAVGAYAMAGDVGGSGRWGNYLLEIGRQIPGNVELQREVANGLNILMDVSARLAEIGEMERWFDLLQGISATFPIDAELQGSVASGVRSIIHYHGTRFEFADLEEWVDRMTELRRAAPNNAGVLHMAAASAACAMNHYGDDDKLDDLERHGMSLSEMAAEAPENMEIQQEMARGIGAAVIAYREARELAALERCGDRLFGQAGEFPDDVEIAAKMAHVALSGMSAYANPARLDDMERWCERPTSIADTLTQNEEIRENEARCAYNALLTYGDAGKHGDQEWSLWINRLAAVARRFQSNNTIQERATYFGVNRTNQEFEGWPFSAPVFD